MTKSRTYRGKNSAAGQSKEKPIVHANIKAFLTREKVRFEFLKKRATKHAIEASHVTGIPLSSFAKTLVFVNECGMPFVAVLRADLDVNRHLLQQATGFKLVNPASAQLAEKMSGFPTGGIPPIGHRKKMHIFIDKSLLELENVWCGGGSRTKLVRLNVKDILRLSNGKVSSFSTAKQKPKN